MPGLVRKLVIFAAVDGLILQAHGATDNHKTLLIDYKSCRVHASTVPTSEIPKSTVRLEILGIIGLLTVASYTFLISITQREQVAQLFGKPVYVITDIAVLPLTSQPDASKAIAEVNTAQRKGSPINQDTYSSSESDSEKTRKSPIPADPVDSNSLADTDRPHQEPNSSTTSIVEDVISKRGHYGKVASQWFSRKGWNQDKVATQENPTQHLDEQQPANPHLDLTPEELNDRTTNRPQEERDSRSGQSTEVAIALLPKILRSTKLILTSRSFFFSYDIDITHRLGTTSVEALSFNSDVTTAPKRKYFWNSQMATGFRNPNTEAFLMPIMQGFVGQRCFVIKGRHEHTRAVEILENVEKMPVATDQIDAASSGNCSQNFLLTLISRRSTKRSGLRYLRRGIDDDGNCANAVETEQILCSVTWDQIKIRSFVQFRGSIPLYFSQTPYAFKPIPVLHQPSSKNQAAIKKHFDLLRKEYGYIQGALLVDKQGPEAKIGEAYEEGVKQLNENVNPAIALYWFDFHAECRGMKFENVDRLVDNLKEQLDSQGETVLDEGTVMQHQSGVIRTNCMDCLDRTNVAQSAFGQYILQKELQGEGYEIDLLHDETTRWFNSLWADNGDAISRQYAGTAALKGDFTRTRKRDYRGALHDLGLTLNRYYNNMVNDYFSQAVIDLLLGNVSSKVFEDFESDMMSKDPGISLAGVRDAAIETCTKIAIQDEDEDLVAGWTLLSPAQPNTLRTLPFEESVVLLTDAAFYCCKFDWNSQKVSSFEKIDLLSITKIRFGTYITSTLSERQMIEDLNVGLVIQYKPNKGSIMRVNTRSLQNVISNEQLSESGDGGTGIMSWVNFRGLPSSHTMALKIIPSENALSKSSESPLIMAERICDDIRRAVNGCTDRGEQVGLDMIEKGDIISLAEAKTRTGYLEQLGHSIKKLVWT